MTDTNEFSGEIRVASRIVDQLSSGLYESPAACLKELINNSYDADATLVEVFIKPDADRIIIEDNGTGMSKEEFVKHFSLISQSYKREEGEVSPAGRKKIGKIGIGFIAANEICDTMEIFSTTKGSTELLHVSVHFDKMRLDPATRRRDGETYAKGDFTGETLSTDRASHFTQVFLKRVRPTARELFAGETSQAANGPPRTLYGKSLESMYRELQDPHLTSWSEFDSYSQNLLRLALNVPIAYFDGWVPSSIKKLVSVFQRRAADLTFTVKYDGAELRKPVVLRPPRAKKCLVSRLQFKGKHVAADGYFYVQHGAVRPRELHGLLIRIRQAAVGSYDTSFLGFPLNEGSLIQRWISAEVWADDRLEEALNIDRKTLRITEPAYIELQDAVHQHVVQVIAVARRRLYQAGSKERQEAKVRSAVDTVARFAREELEPIDRAAARNVLKTWRRPKRGDTARAKSLLRKYTVADLYRIVLDVARDVLDAEQLARFVRRLTQRLNQ